MKSGKCPILSFDAVGRSRRRPGGLVDTSYVYEEVEIREFESQQKYTFLLISVAGSVRT